MMPGYPGAPQQGGSQDYDFATLYGMADHSTGHLYPEGWYDAVVETAEYGRSKDGSKGQWTVKFRTTTGQDAGRSPITTTLSISPQKNDGSPNPQGLGILFRQLAALGIPVPDPANPSATLNGPAPFWVQQMPYEHVASMMIGRPAQIKIFHDDYDGVTRSKIRDIRPPKPGAPTTWPQPQQPQMAPAGYPQQPQNPYGQPPAGGFAPPAYGQPPAQQPQGPWNPAAAGDPTATQPMPGAPNPWQQPQQPGYPQQGYAYGAGGSGSVPQNVQPGAPMQPLAAAQPQAPQVPGAPAWAQPGQPGQGGNGQFTPQGQAQYPGQAQPGQVPPVPQPPWQQPQTAPQDPQAQQGPTPGQPPAPWMQ